MQLTLQTPKNFSFKRTVISHGWSALLPFEMDEKNWVLTRVMDVGERPPVTVTMTGGNGHVAINPSRRINKTEAGRILHDARHILRLDDDLQPFYLATSELPEFAWIAEQGAGRMLRSPTVYEDLVKMICTTNCSWSLTEKMVTGLVNNLGRESNDGRRSFPPAEAMASMPAQFYVDVVRAGYRAPYLKELADRVASGELDVEAWLTAEVSTAELVKQIKGVKGAGDYAAENLLKLLGRYDGLALDSWTRAKFFKVRNNGRKANDKKIERYYSRFKEWRGLALWCDVTRDWLE